jgi:hypothetical protein
VKGDRAVIESNGKDIAIFSMINGYHKTFEVDVSLPSELDFRLTDLSVYMPYDW